MRISTCGKTLWTLLMIWTGKLDVYAFTQSVSENASSTRYPVSENLSAFSFGSFNTNFMAAASVTDPSTSCFMDLHSCTEQHIPAAGECLVGASIHTRRVPYLHWLCASLLRQLSKRWHFTTHRIWMRRAVWVNHRLVFVHGSCLVVCLHWPSVDLHRFFYLQSSILL